MGSLASRPDLCGEFRMNVEVLRVTECGGEERTSRVNRCLYRCRVVSRKCAEVTTELFSSLCSYRPPGCTQTSSTAHTPLADTVSL